MLIPFDAWNPPSLRFRPETNRVLEIWTYLTTDGAKTICDPISRDLHEKDLRQWLDIKHEKPADTQTVSGLRLILGDCSISPPSHPRIPFSPEGFNMLMSSLNLPLCTNRILLENSSSFAKFTKRDKSGKLEALSFVFKIGIHSTGYYTLAMNYNPENRLTTGLLLTQASDPDIGGIVALMKDAKSASGQPMLLPVMITELTVKSASKNINNTDDKLSMLEEKTGQHAMFKRPRGNPLKIDLLDTTTTLNGISTQLDISERRLNAHLLVLEATRQWGELLMERSPLNSNDLCNEALKQQQMDLDEHTENLVNLCKNLLLKYNFNKKRVETQLAVVYNFMAQKGNLLNVQIAMAAKRDGAAVKAISLLTMVFLPATFIATLFGMPLFDWDAKDGHSVFKHRFKYFWIVSIPLTLLVVLGWTAWTVWRGWLTEKEYVRGNGDDQQQ